MFKFDTEDAVQLCFDQETSDALFRDSTPTCFEY